MTDAPPARPSLGEAIRRKLAPSRTEDPADQKYAAKFQALVDANNTEAMQELDKLAAVVAADGTALNDYPGNLAEAVKAWAKFQQQRKNGGTRQ